MNSLEDHILCLRRLVVDFRNVNCVELGARGSFKGIINPLVKRLEIDGLWNLSKCASRNGETEPELTLSQLHEHVIQWRMDVADDIEFVIPLLESPIIIKKYNRDLSQKMAELEEKIDRETQRVSGYLGAYYSTPKLPNLKVLGYYEFSEIMARPWSISLRPRLGSDMQYEIKRALKSYLVYKRSKNRASGDALEDNVISNVDACARYLRRFKRIDDVEGVDAEGNYFDYTIPLDLLEKITVGLDVAFSLQDEKPIELAKRRKIKISESSRDPSKWRGLAVVNFIRIILKETSSTKRLQTKVIIALACGSKDDGKAGKEDSIRGMVKDLIDHGWVNRDENGDIAITDFGVVSGRKLLSEKD